jgi:rhodanese-related sulfurtransferase
MPFIDINAEKLRELIKNEKDNLEIIDVRESEEYAAINIKNSKLIPLMSLLNRSNEIDWNKKVVFICRSGNRSVYAAEMFSQEKETMNLAGGIYGCYVNWNGENFEIDEKKTSDYF